VPETTVKTAKRTVRSTVKHAEPAVAPAKAASERATATARRSGGTAPRRAEATAKRPARVAAKGVGPTVQRAATLAPGFAIVVHETRRGRRAPQVEAELARVLARSGAEDDVELAFGSGKTSKLSLARWQEVAGDVRDLVREELAALDAAARAALLERLVLSSAPPGWSSPQLSAALHAIREVLRERLPRCVVEDRRPAGLSVEALLAVDRSSFWITGWVHDEDGRGAVAIVSPESARVEITESAVRYERPDVVQFYAKLGEDRTREHGFTAFFTLPAPSLLGAGWLAELRTSDGEQLEVACPAVLCDPHAARSSILGELAGRGPIGGPLAAKHGRHALTLLQRRIVAESQIASIDVYGQPPRQPTTSIVVPLYKRIDFLEHQLLHLCRDPDLAEAELIYVLDSVEQTDELAAKARELFALHGLPFKVLNLTASAGFAGANKHGIAVARGRRLLLLNSDVIPDRPGWIAAMNEFYEATPRIGALGPKLLYEDDSLQHAGLYFHRAADSGPWENAHCFKGLHRSFPAANIARPVPAVTGACMLIDRELYEQAGGLPLHYLQGDYEDSELCLRLLDAGRENWYLPAVELYHLEGQSYTPGVRRAQGEYNMWLHTELWGDRIAAEMACFDPNATAAAAKQEGLLPWTC
jgi:O-antigen biosynthesis protein